MQISRALTACGLSCGVIPCRWYQGVVGWSWSITLKNVKHQINKYYITPVLYEGKYDDIVLGPVRWNLYYPVTTIISNIVFRMYLEER